MAYEFKVENKFILDAELKAENSQLKRALKEAQEGARGLEQSLRDTRDEYEALQSEFERFKSGAGIQEMQERLDGFERSAKRSAAAYRSFLESVNLKYTGHGGIFGLTDAEVDVKRQLDKIKADIESGVMSLPDAITKVKLNFGHLFEENYSKTGSAMDPAVYEGIANALTALGSKLDTVLQKFETFGTGGGAATGAKATAENFKQIGDAAEQMMNSVGNSGEFTKQLIDHLANINQVANTVSDTLTGMSALIQQINEKSLGTNLNLTMANDSQRAISIVKQQVLDYADAIVQAQQELARLSKSDAWAQIAPRGSELSRSLGQVTASLMRFDLGSITKGLQSNFVQSAGAINKYVEQVKSYANILLPFMERIKEAGVTTFDTAKLTAPVITDEGIQKLQTEQSSAAQAINQIVSSLGQEAKAVSDTDARYAEHAKAIADAANAERQKMEASRELSVALLDELRHLQEIAKAAKADTGDDWQSRMLVAAEGIHSATKSLNEYTTASKEAAQAQKEFKEGASVKTASGNDGAVETAQKLTQEIHNEQDAVRQADAEYQSHISSVDAATKAEERKIKASELLANAMRGEESATDKATEAANRHQTAVNNQNASNDKEEQRMQRLAAAEAEYYAKQEKARADAEAKKQAQIDSEVAKHNVALDKEEAAVEAATKREIEAWDRAEKAKIASVEKAAAAAAAAEQKAADAAQRATYNDARRAVNRYYGLLTSKDTNVAKREDVIMTEAGWASQSGRYAELAQQLNDAKTAYDLFTGAQKESMMSGQQVAAINELIATRQKDYALAVENTTAKEAEHAQKAEELAQKKQAEAEAARAAKEAKQQEAEATKAQAQAERDAAKAAKEAEQNANRKKNYITQLNNLLVKCEGAERKYAAASKLSNARDNYEGIQRTKEEIRKLLVELEKESPDLDRVAAGLRNCTTEYSKNSTALQTNTSLVGRYVTSGVQQLKSRLQYSLGLAAMVYKAVGEVKKMVSTAVELDSAMNTLQIVTRASGAEMDEYGKRVSSMAKETAQATKDLIDATTVYARLGYSMDESAILSKYTAMLQSVGDIDASSAQNAITAIIKAFDKGVDDIEDVMDKMVLVGNGFPISVAQIAEGMNNAGSMLHVAGNSFEESIALLTAANSTIQNISKASTGLRTIAARIRKTTTGEDDDGEIVEEAKYQEMINALTKHRVSLIDEETKQYRSTYEIIKDIAAVWGEMTSMEQAAVVEALAGTRQQNIFASLMTQFGTAEDAVERMKDSAGELQEAYDIRMESIQAHINTLKAAFDELAMKVVNSDFAKGVVDIVTKIIEGLTALVDKIGGVGVALAALGGLAAVKFITGGGLEGAILSVTKTVLKLGEAFAMLPELLAVAGIVASIAGLVAIVKELKKRYDEAHPSFELAQKLLDEAGKKVDELNGKLETNKSRIRELEELYRTGDFTVVDEAELRKLEAENTLLETQLEIQKGIEAYRAKQVHDTAVEKANTLLGNNADEYPLAQTIQNAIDNYRQAQKDLEDAQKYFEGKGDKATQTDQTYVDVAMYNLEQRTTELDGVLQDIGNVIEKLNPKEDAELIEALTKAVADFTDSIDGNSKKSKKWAADLKDLEKRYGSNLDALKRLARGEQVTREEGEKLRRWMLDCRYTAEDLTDMMLQMGDSMNDLTSAESETGGNSRLDTEIYKWGTMVDEIERARNAIDNYNKALEGGNNGDIAGKMQDAWQKAMEEIDAGREDSRAAWALYEMVFSPEQIDAMGRNAHNLAQAVQAEFFRGIFDDSNAENGYDDADNPYGYGQRLLQYLEQNIASLDGIDVWRDDSGLHYWIDDFSALADQIGIAEPLLDALLDDLDAYGSQLLTDTKQNTELINSLRSLTSAAGDAREGVKDFIKASFERYADADDTTMLRILDSLHDQGVLTVDPKEYRSLLDLAKEEMQKEADQDPTVVPVEPDEQGLLNQGADMLNNFQAFLDSNPRKLLVQPVMGNIEYSAEVPSWNTNSNKQTQKSSGTSSNSGSSMFEGSFVRKSSASGKRAGIDGGDTLVNELGPELISDQGRAFIANGGRPGFVKLSTDAIVFTADETKDILHGKRNVNAKALANGNVGRGSLINRLVRGGTNARASFKTCPNCGRSNNASNTRCYFCGASLGGTSSYAATTYAGSYGQANAGVNRSALGSPTAVTTGRNQGGNGYYYNPSTQVITYTTYTYDEGSGLGYGTANNYNFYESMYQQARRDQEKLEAELYKARQKAIQDSNEQKRQTSTNASGGYAGSGGGNYVGGANYASMSDPQKVDWVAVRINRLQRTIADLEKIASSGFKKLDTRLRYTKDQITNITDELKVQQQAYDRYIQEANSIGLSESIAANVREGTIDITKYDDDTRKKIDEYTEW